MMSPSNHHVVQQLRNLIFYNLDMNLPRNALFFAGRMQAYEPRASEAAYMLALCHLRLEQYKSAYESSKNSGSRGTHLGCTYVFAQSCLALAKYSEGIVALERSRGLWFTRNNWNKHTDTRRQSLPDAASVYCLQGKLYHAFQEYNKAIEAYLEALKLNPFMWDAFMALSDLGVELKVEGIFKITSDMMSALSLGTLEETPLGTLGDVVQPASQAPTSHTNTNDPFSVSTNRVNDNRLHLSKQALFEKMNGKALATTPVSLPPIGPTTIETPSAPSVNVLAQVSRMKDASAAISESGISHEPPQAPARKQRQIPGVDFKDLPPVMKASSSHSSRYRNNVDGDSAEVTFPATASSFAVSDRKRTASGRVAESNGAAQINGIGEGTAPPRRSSRLTKPSSRIAAAAGPASDATRPREIKKTKAPIAGTKIGSIRGQVGRAVSGNTRKEPVESDAKEHRHAAAVTTLSNNTAPSQAPKSNSERVKEQRAIETLLALLKKLGASYFLISNYRCKEALHVFDSMDKESADQVETPWVLAQKGRAHFEQASYAEAERIFARVRTMAPTRLEDMEVYSTALWFLKRDVDLAHLAHELITLDRLSPQAWIAVGNSFSLQRDHDQALKCFKRATQLDPTFAYAFTLQGHEHISNEEFDKAMMAFRNGIIADNRHYNAWYGMAKVYEMQGKFDMAEQHYKVASDINPTNAILLCNIGQVLEKRHKMEEALAKYVESVELAPTSWAPRFKQARVLTLLKRNRDALQILDELKTMAPNEANVHFLLGRVHKNLDQKQEAIKHFTAAQNLDPKASHYIKEALEQMEYTDEEGDGNM